MWEGETLKVYFGTQINFTIKSQKGTTYHQKVGLLRCYTMERIMNRPILIRATGWRAQEREKPWVVVKPSGTAAALSSYSHSHRAPLLHKSSSLTGTHGDSPQCEVRVVFLLLVRSWILKFNKLELNFLPCGVCSFPIPWPMFSKLSLCNAWSRASLRQPHKSASKSLWLRKRNSSTIRARSPRGASLVQTMSYKTDSNRKTYRFIYMTFNETYLHCPHAKTYQVRQKGFSPPWKSCFCWPGEV